ncbi:MAG: hypothetical protein JXR97_07100, partial [Planctomycetes bacterium]|nr:hypothetical protein [Planctomycetota bacterium]
MRIKKIIVSLALIGGFCSYLMVSSADDANTSSSNPSEPILLSQKVMVPATIPAPAEDEDMSEPEMPMPPAPPAGEIALAVDEPEVAEEFIPDSQGRSVWAIVTAYCPCRRCCG